VNNAAILTINDYNNYGNRLQNYATQEVVKSVGFQAITIVNIKNKINSSNNSLVEVFQKLKVMSNRERYDRVKREIWFRINSKAIAKSNTDRLKAFKEFTVSNIRESSFTISDSYIPNDLSERFDFFITGSDQVWNPVFRNGSPIDFLTFAPKQKRIAFSPSFGISEIPVQYVEDYRLWLSEMPWLSVREEAGAKIIEDLTGRDAVVLVDPTLMLTKEKWLSVSKPASNKPGRYLLTYFLGKIPKENKKRIQQIALMNNLQIVNLGDVNDPITYAAGPSEFIDYINSASVLFTDSFHGAVFSILLETPFVICDRVEHLPSMGSRIDTLLSTFNLYSRKWHTCKDDNAIFNADYSHIQPILEFERKKALDYLKTALQIKY